MPAVNIVSLNKLNERHIKTIKNAAPEVDINIIQCDAAEAHNYIEDTEILLAWGWMDIRDLYLKAPKLKWVHSLSAGVEKLIFPEMLSSSTVLTNSKGIHGIPVSEHVLAMMLAFTRGLNVFIRQQDQRVWQRAHVDEIYEKTIGIIGLGSIGREIAKKAKGLGMYVVATKRELTSELFVDKLYKPSELIDMLAVCDFVVAALPLTPETKAMINLEHFTAMKRSAYFFNIARGGVINESDLCTALEQKLIKGAGLDVFEDEPLPESSPLWDMPNVIITPHLAALSPCYLDRAIKLFADNLSRYLINGEMFNIIDKTKGY